MIYYKHLSVLCFKLLRKKAQLHCQIHDPPSEFQLNFSNGLNKQQLE